MCYELWLHSLASYFTACTVFVLLLLPKVNKPEDFGQGLLDSSPGKGLRKVKGLNLVLKQLFALLIKRFHRATRNQKDFLGQVVQVDKQSNSIQ